VAQKTKHTTTCNAISSKSWWTLDLNPANCSHFFIYLFGRQHIS